MKSRCSVAPNLEIFEEKVLLSTGIGKPAAAVAIIASKTPKPFKFNGKLPLKLTATYTGLAPGFREKQPFPPMGEKVKVSGTLVHPGVASSDGLPNLADSTFQLSNATGSLLVTFSSSTTNAYGFTISGGTKRFVRADGTAGTAVLARSARGSYSLTFKTTTPGGQSSNPSPGGQLTILASYNRTSNGPNGGFPNLGVVLDQQGNLYGTTLGGGTSDVGTVYEIASGSRTIVTIASFGAASGGGSPRGSVALDAQGNLYGTTGSGGPGGSGTVWEVVNGTRTITTIGSFNFTNGSNPNGVTLDSQGNLYGTTSLGGTGGVGTVWELAKGSNTITTLANFDGTNGAQPLDGVTLDAQGNLYGSTTAGGPNLSGTVWEIVKGSHTIAPLFSQGSNDLVLDAQGNFYLTGHAQIGEPIVEELSKLADGTYGISKVFTFTGMNASELVDGLTLDAQGNLYGATEQFSLLGQGGMLWEIATGSNTITTLATFSGTNGRAPVSDVAFDGSGNLYGNTGAGGAFGFGTVWEFIVGADPSVRSLI
jgi:uncharacterized repeat protein (TIGR03803 family)